ncbi:MAG: flagellar basal-body rod protein FlgF [Holosporales bacterium]|jgi:flagellar basal-body rod protein FlgF|nr:flagellar basal-body rod protein FlgF [Holosporales bacterium]
MDSGSLVALSQQRALQRSMEVVAQNLANANTEGYKSEKLCFKNLIKKASVNHDLSYVVERGALRDFSEGPGKTTDNPLHLMIHGTGFFPIQTEWGTYYTRCGVFELNAELEIVTASGDPLLAEDGLPIVVPEGTKNITVARDGTISADQHVMGRIKAHTFKNEQNLVPEGHNLFSAQEKPVVNNSAEILQGMVEQSNVNPIYEMTRMIEILRRYQEIQHAMNSHKERQDNSIDRLVKII